MRAALYLTSLSADLLGWLAVLIIWALWGEGLRWEHDALVCQLKRASWPVSKDKWLGGWYLRRDQSGNLKPWGGTTLSPHAIFYGPHRDMVNLVEEWSPSQHHEHTHTKQGEVWQVASFVVGVVFVLHGHPITGAIVWTLGYTCMGASGWTSAWLRGLPAYRGSVHEEHAYLVTERELGILAAARRLREREGGS